jgi:diguanylate cyclase (GGDEF)-like protein
MENVNIFSAIAYLTAAFSFSIFVFSIYVKPFREATIFFTFLSILIFLNSVFFLFTLHSSSEENAIFWAYLLESIMLFIPLLFAGFINRFLGNFMLRVKLIYKLLFFIPPLGILIYLIINRAVGVKEFNFGYMLVYDEQFLIGVFYLTPLYLFITFIILRDSYRRQKEGKYRRPGMIMAVGFIIFLLVNIIYRPLALKGYMAIFPASSISNFILFLFITIGLMSNRYNIKNKTLRKIFEDVDDCIIITDADGKVVEFNRCLFKDTFLPDDKMTSDVMDKIVKGKLKEYMVKPGDYNNLIRKLEGNLTKSIRSEVSFIKYGKERIYDVNISPINDVSGKLIGKLAIFRDITSNKFYQEELKKQSLTDYLTGAYNIRHVFKVLQGEIDRYKRYGDTFCVLLMDIDKFKRYNDTYGHREGDKLLMDAVKLFKKNARENIDTVGRYGGDEFIIILSRINLDEAKNMAERILDNFNKSFSRIISLSIGVYEYRGSLDVNKLISKADALMYKAKKLGGKQLAHN